MESNAMPGPHEFLELRNEYDYDIPLFDQTGWLGGDQKTIRRSLGLDQTLLDELRQWQADWQAGHGWLWHLTRDEEDRDRYKRHNARGEQLRLRVQEHVHPLPVHLGPPPDQVKHPSTPFITRAVARVRALFSMRRVG